MYEYIKMIGILINMLREFVLFIVKNDVISFNVITTIANNMNEKNGFISMLISGEISLIAIYLVFLPLIVENKSREYYLGYRES